MRAILLCSAFAILVPATAHADGALLLHVPPGEANVGEPIDLVAAVDGAWREGDLVARWRARGAGAWHDATFRHADAGGWHATIPGDAVGSGGVEYYIAGEHEAHFASAEAPHVVAVAPSRIDQLAEVDRARHRGRTEELTLDVDGHDFGNRFDRRDQYLRGDLRWTHRSYGVLYATHFGFSALEGVTPDGAGTAAGEMITRARWGHGGVTLRATPAVFVDAQLALGFSHDGFIGGAAGAITLGRPWATCVSIGGEYLGDLGGTAYLRLQWDTAPPLLMGASIVRTDLPGAVLEDGALIRYDVAYPFSAGVTARAAVSIGARDGSPHVGGGVGLAYEF